jgi:phage tail-like protein
MHRSSFLPLVVFSLAAAALPLKAGSRNAFGPFTIKVEIEGVTQGVFQSVEGLTSESEVLVEMPDSLGPALPGSQAPGALRNSRLILKRPFDPLLTGLWQWRQSVVDGDPQRRDGDIYIFNDSGTLVAHWVFRQGWPCRWSVPRLVSDSVEPAEEIVEIVHGGLALEIGTGS